MPAPIRVRPRERFAALAAVALVQGALIFALLSGFRVDVPRTRDAVEQLIELSLPEPPPRVRLPPPKPAPREQHAEAAPKAAPAPLGGSPGPRPAHVAPAIAPVVAVRPSAPAAGGGAGTGPALGSGSGGGTGGNGYGSEDEGGTDLQQIAGEITSRDYPRDLRDAGIGGRVLFVFKVEPNGRVGRCSITRSSGSPELDALTCRLVQQRFVYRPSTDRFGRPIEDEVDGEHDWVAGRR
jgi:protein TonB